MAGSLAAAAALKQLRLAARLSQEELAERCHVSERTIRSLESGTAKRPHRGTLEAVARALDLSPAAAAHFVASWRPGHLTLEDLLAGRNPDVAFEQDLSAQRERVRELAVHYVASVDARGRIRFFRLRRTFEVLQPGVDRFAWMSSFDPEVVDGDLVAIRDCVNMAVVSGFVMQSSSAKAFVADLGRELEVGETCSVEYTVGYEQAYGDRPRGHDDTEALFASRGGVAALSFDIHFDPAATPTSVHPVRMRSVTAPATTGDAIRVGPFGIGQYTLAPASPGVHGLRWAWGDDVH